MQDVYLFCDREGIWFFTPNEKRECWEECLEQLAKSSRVELPVRVWTRLPTSLQEGRAQGGVLIKTRECYA